MKAETTDQENIQPVLKRKYLNIVSYQEFVKGKYCQYVEDLMLRGEIDQLITFKDWKACYKSDEEEISKAS